MVKRHEGVYDGRYKLMHFYDINEWELIDTKKDPDEMKSEYDNPEYAKVVVKMKKALEQMKTQYEVPEGIPAPRSSKYSQSPEKYLSTARKAKDGVLKK